MKIKRCDRVSGVPPEADQVPGVRFQVSGKRNRESETCWSEAEIPSEAKRQRGTLKPLIPQSAIRNLKS